MGKVVNLNTRVEGKVAQLRRKISSDGHDSPRGLLTCRPIWDRERFRNMRRCVAEQRGDATRLGDARTGQAGCRLEH